MIDEELIMNLYPYILFYAIIIGSLYGYHLSKKYGKGSDIDENEKAKENKDN